MELTGVVVVPARDEQETIGACLRALAAQTIGRQRFETIVVLDGCRDDTAAVVASTAAASGLRLSTLTGPGRGAGAARRLGMDAAAERLFERGRPDGLIICTDADSRPAADWLERQLAHARDGARAIAGFIELDPIECRRLPEPVLRRRDRDAAMRLRRVRDREPEADHHHFAGASLAVTAAVYRTVGGLEPLEALEDAAFADRLTDHRIPIHRPLDVRVTTSARARGRARRGLSLDLEVSTWSDGRRYRASDFQLERVAAAKRAAGISVSVIVPTKECAETIVGVVRDAIGPPADAGLVDELVVIDADSRDGTAAVAAAAGATVLQQDAVLSEFGPALGKGDAMWRALSATGGDVVCFLDGDTGDPHPDHLLGLLGPILSDGRLSLVKGTFERALQTGDRSLAHEGGRVTELMARPLINLHEPRLAGFAQPLAGEFAARRSLLESLPFPVGYGVEIALLIDALRSEGLDALAECDLGRRQNRHQPLRALGEMAYAVLAAVERRLGEDRPAIIGGNYMRPWEDGAVVSVPVIERRPLVTLKSGRRHRTAAASC
jgi:glycosyltransferase involved in cell wall biosynthesis